MTFITQMMQKGRYRLCVFVDRNCRERDIRKRLVMQFETRAPDLCVKNLSSAFHSVAVLSM